MCLCVRMCFVCAYNCVFVGCRYNLSAGTSEKIQLGALLGAFQIVRDMVVQQAA